MCVRNSQGSPVSESRQECLGQYQVGFPRTSLVKNRLEQELRVDLSFGQLFGQGTVRDLALYLGISLEASSGTERSSRQQASEPGLDERYLPAKAGSGAYPLSCSQEQLWFLGKYSPAAR
jgi:hypothetical protein